MAKNLIFLNFLNALKLPQLSSITIVSENWTSNGIILLTFLISLIKLSSEINLTLLSVLSIEFHCFGWGFGDTKSLYPIKIPNNIKMLDKVIESLKLILPSDFLFLKILRIKIKIPPHVIIKQRN